MLKCVEGNFALSVYINSFTLFSFNCLFGHGDEGAIAVRQLLQSTVHRGFEQRAFRSHVLYLASCCMYRVAQFPALEYDGFLAGLPDEFLQLLFGLQLISSKAQPYHSSAMDDRLSFYSMLEFSACIPKIQSSILCQRKLLWRVSSQAQLV